ncbi:MAG: type I secretion system permease/ATPase [Burkholderiales bacterium]|jgi:PrtD family type I secretion system ABC transporter|nr:type I secretion system permease/ATPase [Burkholderiales bacterium]
MSLFTPPIDTKADQAELSPLRKALQECKTAFSLMAFITFVTNILGIVPTLYMMNMYDRVLSSKSGVTLISLMVLVIGVYLFWSALEWIRNRIMIRISLRIDWDLAAKAFDASFRRNAGRRKVNIQQVMGDLLTLRQFLTGRSLIAVVDAPFSIIYIIVGGLIHPLLAAFSFASTFIVGVIAVMNRKVATPALRAANEASGEATRLAAQSLRYAETATAMGMLPAIRNRWHEKHRWFLQHQVNGSEASGLMGWVGGVVSKMMPSIQMALGIFLAIQGVITGGMVIAATFLVSRSVGPIKSLISNWKDVVNARLAFERLDQLLLEDEKREQRMSLPAPTGRLALSEVQACPPESKQVVLNHVDFSLEPGEALAVIGPNAAGKSSMLKVLLGLWKPSSGSVRLDGVEMSDWNHDELGPHLGYVPQEADLFEATIAENIARLNVVDSEKVVAAAKAAGVHEVILGFPEGYDTFLGDAGFALSGGQAQRVCIARALYGDPKLVVLDEPNAKLDESAETELMMTLRDLKAKGVTVVFTTHRPRLLAVADYLLVLKASEQVGFGPIKEMLAKLNTQKKDPVAADVKPKLQAVSETKPAPGAQEQGASK